MTGMLQPLPASAYTHLPAGMRPGPSTALNQATHAAYSNASSAADAAAKAASNAANAVADRMRNNGWYGMTSSGSTENLRAHRGKDDTGSEDDERAVHTPATARQANTEEHQGDGWRLWQTVNDKVKWQSVNEKMKGLAVAARKRAGGDDGLCESDDEDFDGPGDSHLIRVMKEYYIEQSTSPNDLPVWLFPDRVQSSRRAWESEPTAQTASRYIPNRTISNQSDVSGSSSNSDYGHYRRSAVTPSTHARAMPPRQYSDPHASRLKPSVASPTRSLQAPPDTHGSRTAQKLRQMKTVRA